MRYRKCQPLVLCVPTFGIVRTNLWYCAYQPLVLCVPTFGIVSTNLWYCAYQVLVFVGALSEQYTKPQYTGGTFGDGRYLNRKVGRKLSFSSYSIREVMNLIMLLLLQGRFYHSTHLHDKGEI